MAALPTGKTRGDYVKALPSLREGVAAAPAVSPPEGMAHLSPTPPSGGSKATPHLRSFSAGVGGLGGAMAMRRKMRRSPSGRIVIPSSIVISGGTGTIGAAIVQELLYIPAIKVYVLTRSMEKFEARKVVWDKRKPDETSTAIPVLCDVSSKKSLGDFITDFKKKNTFLDVLICAAAVAPTTRTVAPEEKLEMTFVVNVLSYHRLAKGLASLLNNCRRRGGGRVIYISANDASDLDCADLHFRRRDYNNIVAYHQSKAALRVLIAQMEAKWKGTYKQVSYFSCHPGFTASPLTEAMGVDSGIHTARESAATPVFLALDAKITRSDSGKYWVSKRVSIDKFSKYKDAEMLWNIVEKCSTFIDAIPDRDDSS